MINMTHGTVKIFAGNGCPDLAKAIADRLELPLGQLEATRFSDGEICVNIKETVRGCDVFVVQSTSTPVNDNLMELLVMIDAFKRASCNKLTVVMPYFGYARQDRKARARDPITAKLVANLLEKAGADRVLTMDLHSTQLQGFFDIPVDNLLGMPVLAKYFLKNGFKNDDLVIVSPDVGSVTRSRSMAAKFNAPLAIIDKRRPRANVAEIMNIIGEVKGRTCVITDDIVDTAGTLCNAAGALKERGATRVLAYAAHPVFSGNAIERIKNSALDEVVVTDTIPLRPEAQECPKIRQLSCAPLVGETISRIAREDSVSELFNE